MTELLDDNDRSILIDDLIDGHHHAESHQRLDELGGLDGHLLCQLSYRDRLGNGDIANNRCSRHLEGVARGLGTNHRTGFLLLAPAACLVARDVQLRSASPATVTPPTALAAVSAVSTLRIGTARGRGGCGLDGRGRTDGGSVGCDGRRCFGNRGRGDVRLGRRFGGRFLDRRTLLLLGLAKLAQRLFLLAYLRLRPQGLVEFLLTTLRFFLQRTLRGVHARLRVAFFCGCGNPRFGSRPGARRVHAPSTGLYGHRLPAALRRCDSQFAH